MGFIAVLSFIVVWLNYGDPFSPEDNVLNLLEKFFLFGLHLS